MPSEKTPLINTSKYLYRFSTDVCIGISALIIQYGFSTELTWTIGHARVNAGYLQ